MNSARWAVALGALLLGVAWLGVGRLPEAPYRPERPPNWLVVVLDDVGQDMVGAYGVHPEPVPTPHLNALAERGLRFNHAIAHPVCSPSRGSLLTGRFPHELGIGSAISPKEQVAMPLAIDTVAKVLKDSGLAYHTEAVGKWHLASPTEAGRRHPRQAGFRHFTGGLTNFHGREGDAGQDYFSWWRIEDEEVARTDAYATTATTDDALRAMARAEGPWLVYVAYHGAHAPMHDPPAALVAQPDRLSHRPSGKYRNMVQSLDAELGRLIEGIPPQDVDHTYILVLGDNGSAPVGVRDPWLMVAAKGSMARGGVRVPFVVAGPEVAVGETDALVQLTDVFATVLESAGLDNRAPHSSVSFFPVLRGLPGARRYAFAEQFSPNGTDRPTEHEAMVRDERYKVVFQEGRPSLFFDLMRDPMEKHDLLGQNLTPEQRQALRRLKRATPRVIQGTSASATRYTGEAIAGAEAVPIWEVSR